ncbi:hypothetical protein [Lysobacter sp. Root690]|uniref:hypothetical protein n=1 Tax=Lysobacter sp. Root690 TaxID=1736588 RepID=UPI00070053B6|nr:hypothetical protein [Lysobacter sp. Root690]KRB03393.1 hypothetical protein ASD86_21200 [Lysobacter sp. Root690]
MLRIQRYAEHFGSLATDDGVEAMLRELGVKRRPMLGDPPRSPYEAVLQIKSLGMLLSFTERNYWENLPENLHGKSDELVFTNISVTSGIPGRIKPYDGEMPFGLDWNDTRAQARDRLVAQGHGDVLHAYKRDAWWLADYRLRVTYQPGDLGQAEQAGLYDISLGIAMPASDAPFVAADYPSPEQIRDLFGRSAHSEEFRRAFRDFDPDGLVAAVEHEAVNRKCEFGFELYFDPRHRADDGTPAFVGLDMVRDRLGDSRPWLGGLPSGLGFDDSPAVLQEKIGRKADQWQESHTWGVARWYSPDQLLWINFDTLDNRLESVSLLAPGYRDDLRK